MIFFVKGFCVKFVWDWFEVIYIKEVESKKLMSRYEDRFFLDKFMFVYSLGKLKLRMNL